MTTSYTDFTCRSGGSNLNAGTTLGAGEEATAPFKTYSNGSNVGGVFTVAAGNPVADGITVGMFASMYIDGGSPPTATPFVGRITAVSTTNITISTSSAAGAIPANGANRTVRVGGAWAGPNTTDQAFPLTLATLGGPNTLTTNFPARYNFKNDQTYTVSAATTSTTSGAATLQGYTTTFGDVGRATLTGGTSGASFNLINFTGATSPDIRDFVIKNNGATGSAHGITATGRQYCRGVVFTGMLGAGYSSTNNFILEECEVYGNNISNTASLAGVLGVAQAFLLRCFIHDNTGSNTCGVLLTSTAVLVAERSIFSGNGLHGIGMTTSSAVMVDSCDFYNNGGSGFAFVSAANSVATINNSNFVKNGAWGINFNTFTASSTARLGSVFNCGFSDNTSGTINTASNGLGNMQEIGSKNYGVGVTPWNDPANGDFSITLAAAQNAGRMGFVETSAGLSAPNTSGSIDIGAAQHTPSGGGGGGLLVNPGMRGGMI